MAVKTWRVVVEGSVRETYLVRAESAREAMEDWHHHKPVSSEVADAEAVSAVLDEPEPSDRCPECKHAPHTALGFCPNMASDNDCDCTYVGES